MDELKRQFKEFRGCFIFLGVCIVLGIFGGTTALLEPRIGGSAALVGLAGALVAVLVWIGLAKNARWAKVIAGSILLLAGLGLTGFLIFDFVTSLVKGESLLKTPAVSASGYGQSMFIMVATGIAMVGGGLMLVGWLKTD